MNSSPQSVFVTGATGLLGHHLVHLLISRGFRVKALVRSRERAERQFADLPVEIVFGDMCNVTGFAAHLRGVDLLFHTAAYFRDSFKGGRHMDDLQRVNVLGTRDLLSHAYSAGIRRVVHTSSVAVLSGAPGERIDETMLRDERDALDYPLSKIRADLEVASFLDTHLDVSACTVLPGWMIGPGDIGPTSSGQLILDFLNRKLPGIPPAVFSVVDARDVAEAHIAAAFHGKSGERYIAAGKRVEMIDLFALLESLTGIPAPRRSAPYPVLYGMAITHELWHFFSKRPTLISLASVRFMDAERHRGHFDNSKVERELGIHFRPISETLRDTIAWYRQNRWFANDLATPSTLQAAGGSI